MNRTVIAVAVIVALVAISVGYYEYSSDQNVVVQTTVGRGTVTGTQSSGIPIGQNGNTAGSTFVSIQYGNVTFSQLIGCAIVPFHIGTSVSVADQLLKSGQHNYVADVACRNQASAYSSLHLNSTTTTTSSAH